MFLLYAIAIGLVLGLALRGDPRKLAQLKFHWMPIVFLGFGAQVVLFSEFVSERVGDLGPPLYVFTTVAVLAAIVRNVRIPGLPIVAAGSISNLVAIIANGGFMPASSAAMASLGKAQPEAYSNSAVLANPALELLTDIFALPRWLPFANVFSVGDVLIAVGVVWAIVATMRSDSPMPSESPLSSASATTSAEPTTEGLTVGDVPAPTVASGHLSLVTDSTGTDRPFADSQSGPNLLTEGQ